MIPEIIPIIAPSVNWTEFLRGATDALGYSPAGPSDACSRKLSDPARLIAVLGALQDRAEKPLDALRSSVSLQSHLSYSFLVYADQGTVFHILERSDLAVTATDALDGERIAVVSGTLKQWVQAIVECTDPRQPYNLRLLMDKAFLILKSMGLGDLFHEYSAKPLKDQTFFLEHHK